MTEREIADRLLAICSSADRMRPPSHRHSAEDYVAERDEIRDRARRLYKDLTGSWPSNGVSHGPERRPRPPAPAAVLRHQERLRAAKPA
jgi:hypothetical protein